MKLFLLKSFKDFQKAFLFYGILIHAETTSLIFFFGIDLQLKSCQIAWFMYSMQNLDSSTENATLLHTIQYYNFI